MDWDVFFFGPQSDDFRQDEERQEQDRCTDTCRLVSQYEEFSWFFKNPLSSPPLLL